MKSDVLPKLSVLNGLWCPCLLNARCAYVTRAKHVSVSYLVLCVICGPPVVSLMERDGDFIGNQRAGKWRISGACIVFYKLALLY